MTVPSDLFELKVIVEAEGWHDVSTLMASVDRALDAHRLSHEGNRHWSVIANRLPDGQARELLWFVDQCDEPTTGDAPGDRMSA